MTKIFKLNVDQSLLLEQLNEVGYIVQMLATGKIVTIGPTDTESLDLFLGVENLLSEIAEQNEPPEQSAHPYNPNPFNMIRSELADWYRRDTGDTLDDAFGSPEWDIIDGQQFVACYLEDGLT